MRRILPHSSHPHGTPLHHPVQWPSVTKLLRSFCFPRKSTRLGWSYPAIARVITLYAFLFLPPPSFLPPSTSLLISSSLFPPISSLLLSKFFLLTSKFWRSLSNCNFLFWRFSAWRRREEEEEDEERTKDSSFRREDNRISRSEEEQKPILVKAPDEETTSPLMVTQSRPISFENLRARSYDLTTRAFAKREVMRNLNPGEFDTFWWGWILCNKIITSWLWG